jgi:hypothetical protein
MRPATNGGRGSYLARPARCDAGEFLLREVLAERSAHRSRSPCDVRRVWRVNSVSLTCSWSHDHDPNYGDLHDQLLSVYRGWGWWRSGVLRCGRDPYYGCNALLSLLKLCRNRRAVICRAQRWRRTGALARGPCRVDRPLPFSERGAAKRPAKRGDLSGNAMIGMGDIYPAQRGNSNDGDASGRRFCRCARIGV